MLAYPYSAYSAKDGLGRAQAVPHGRVSFWLSCLITGSPYMFFYSSVRDNYRFGPCDPQTLSIACEPQERLGTFSREAVNVFSRLVRHRARWLGWHRAGPRAVNMLAVDAATFTNNVVIECIFFFPTICSDNIY